MKYVLRVAALLQLVGSAAHAQADANATVRCRVADTGRLDSLVRAWQDPSPHAVRRVAVAPGVALEVLEWTRHPVTDSSRAFVWLAGFNESAHTFDDIAPRLSSGAARVIGITRRGQPPSDVPPSGYSVTDRASDDLAILHSLGLRDVVLIGHSTAGEELTEIARRAPARVRGLVYLDAAYDRSREPELEPYPMALVLAVAARVDTTLPGRMATACRSQGGLTPARLSEFALGEHLSQEVRRAAARASALIGTGSESYTPAWARITQPMLSLYSADGHLSDLLSALGADRAPANARQDFQAWWWENHAPLQARMRDDVRRLVPTARIEVWENVGHHLYVTAESRVVDEIIRFTAHVW